MAPRDYDIIVTENAPENPEEWNQLVLQCSNIWQSIMNDAVQLFFNNHAVYFQCYAEKKLVAGVKLYRYESKKLPAFIRTISSRVTQGSECLISENENVKEIIEILEKKINQWCLSKNVNAFFHYSFYGEANKLLHLKNYTATWESRIAIAEIDLRKPEDELWHAIHPKHRSEIIKAKKNNLTIEYSDNLEVFFSLLDQTYEYQKSSGPDKTFLKHEFSVFKKSDAAQIVFAKSEDKYLAGALLYTYGKKTLYAFAGTVHNNSGAGQFLHWEIMKHLKSAGINFYLLGETALERNENNLKFSEGITKFKMRFGAVQHPAFHHGFVRSKWKLNLWNLLQKIFIRG